MKNKYILFFVLSLLFTFSISGCNTTSETSEAETIDINDVFDSQTKDEEWENYNEQTFETEILKMNDIVDVSIDLSFDENQQAASANIHLVLTQDNNKDIEQTVIDYLSESLSIDKNAITIESTIAE